MGEFGDKFRKARETKELSFDDVSNVIKISPRMLKAIEEEHFDQLPGGVFNKGFIRAYAKHLGLDSEEAITEYLACLRQVQLEAQQAWQPERPVETPPPAPVKVAVASRRQPVATAAAPVQVEDLPHLQLPRAEDVRPARRKFATGSAPDIPWRLVAVAVVVAVLGVLLWTRHTHTQRTEAAKSPSPAAASGASTTAAQTSPSAAPAQSSTPSSQPTQPASAQSAAEPDTEEKNDVTIRNFGKPLPKSSEQSTGSLTLVVRASENSWISVLADGQLVTEETLIAPAHPSFHASREFVVKVGNAAAVSFLINGKEIAPQGNEAEVKTLSFDSSGLKTSP
jgi:cytoskeletal protein RodZ